MAYITFGKKGDNFFGEVKKKVNNYFVSRGIQKTGGLRLYVKSLVICAIAAASYALLLFCPLPAWFALVLCSVLGASFAAIGFNIMHDGAHGSFSSKRWVNELAGYSLNLMGGNVFIWKNKHNLNHHNYTNIEGMDDDIDLKPWMRTCESQRKRWYHRYQYIYGLFLYCLTYANWIFVGDFKIYFSKKIADTDLNRMKLREHVIFWVSKALFFSLFLVIPIYVVGLGKALIGFSVAIAVCGFILGIVFQLAHLTDEADFPVVEGDPKEIENNWILHQIATTVNFGMRNRLLFWLTGGLNFQVVHHLFPKISHVHYPAINELIRETCEEFQVKYTEYPSFFGAVGAHISYLKQLGAAA